MKSIKYSEYNSSLGLLICIEAEKIVGIDAKYINYEKLLYDYASYLNKNQTYYFICKKGKKSKKLVSLLNIHGYKAIQVIK